MKIFFYKTIFIAFIFFVTFKITFGSTVKYIENKIYNMSQRKNVEYIKQKIREEIQIAITKKEYIKKKDADLINQFLNKIKKDLDKQN